MLGDFEIGREATILDRGGINREGCQAGEDGMIATATGWKGFVSWREIFGSSFIEKYEERKLPWSRNYWFNGRSFYKLLHGCAVTIPKDQLILELRQKGFSTKTKKVSPLEVDSAVLMLVTKSRG